MTTNEQSKQLEDVMVGMLRKQNLTVELAHLRECQSVLNTKLVQVGNRMERAENRMGSTENRAARVENELEDNTRNLLDLRQDVEKFQ